MSAEGGERHRRKQSDHVCFPHEPVCPCKNRADEEKSMACRYVNRFLCSMALLFGSSPVLPAQPKGTPVFSKDIAPILYQHCASCHRAGQIAPMSLLSYEEVRPWAASIREKVALGAMPPWHSAAPVGQFSNDRRLSDAEKALISRWVGGGAPKGDLKDLPPIPTFADD